MTMRKLRILNVQWVIALSYRANPTDLEFLVISSLTLQNTNVDSFHFNVGRRRKIEIFSSTG